MPVIALEFSGIFVEVLCGHPEQKYGVLLILSRLLLFLIKLLIILTFL